MDKELIGTFCDLVKVPSPSGSELNVARYIQKRLRSIGIISYNDGSGKAVGSNSGNIIAKIGLGKPRLMFVAHMDTVEDGSSTIKPTIRNGTIYSDRTTILGSDDKSGVTALLCAIKELCHEKNLPPTLFVFSTKEETDPMGISRLNVEKSINFVFDVDGSDAPGKFINKSLGCVTFELHIYGKEAHAGRDPEKGSHAIKTGAIIVSKLKLGKDTKGGTLNIGKIFGGTRANVIPGYSFLLGEVRAFSSSEIDRKFKFLENIVKGACKTTGCRYKLIRKKGQMPFYTGPNKSIVYLARKASSAAGLKFSLMTIQATIQANELASKGYTVLGLCRGGRMAHSNAEHVSIKELDQTKRLIVEIVKQTRTV